MSGDVLGSVASTIIAWSAIALALSVLWKVAPVRWVRQAVGRSIDDWHRKAIREVMTDVLDNGNRINDRLDTIAADLEQIKAQRGDEG